MKTKIKHSIKNLRSDIITEYQNVVSPISNIARLDLLRQNKARDSAVLILLYPKGNEYYFSLIQRPIYNGKHSNQISIPGGKPEVEDLDLLDTAIRECNEEIGVQVPRANAFYALQNVYIPPSNFLVTPYLTILDHCPVFILDKREVQELIEVNITELNKKNILYSNKIIPKKRVPYYSLQNKIVWGATATILAELHAIIDF